MKIINIDQLEEKIREFGINKGYFTEEYAKSNNCFITNLKGRKDFKSFDLIMVGNFELNLTADTWEDLYYKIWEFFR